MWRAPLLTALALLAQPLAASVFSEGGRLSGGEAIDYEPLRNDEQKYEEEQLREMYERRMAEEEAALAEQAEYENQLADLVAEMQAARKPNEMDGAKNLEIMEQFGGPQHEENVEIELKGAQAPNKEKEEVPLKQVVPVKEKPVVAQKKGQSEFVSFVEPVAAAQTKDIPTLEKRRLAQSANSQAYSPKSDANLLMMAVGCVLVVGVVGGAIGGGVIYRRRKESPDDSEYAPYAGTGPFKRGKKGDKGDESLAYKAQLHHYQQAKQKIICGDDAPGVGFESDEEEGADDENNYSVYECPGLAPTGDIEVHNPNFAAQQQ